MPLHSLENDLNIRRYNFFKSNFVYSSDIMFAEIDWVNAQTFSGDCCENGGQAVYDSSVRCIPISCSSGGNRNK